VDYIHWYHYSKFCCSAQ